LTERTEDTDAAYVRDFAAGLDAYAVAGCDAALHERSRDHRAETGQCEDAIDRQIDGASKLRTGISASAPCSASRSSATFSPVTAETAYDGAPSAIVPSNRRSMRRTASSRSPGAASRSC